MLGRHLGQPVEREQALAVERMLDPGGAVLVEGGDAVLGRDEVRAALGGGLGDEVEDGLLRRAVVPGRQRVFLRRQRQREREGERRDRPLDQTAAVEDQAKPVQHVGLRQLLFWSVSISIAWSIEKLPGFCRGGKSRKVASSCPTNSLGRQQHEQVLDEPAVVAAGLVLGALERVGANVEDLRGAQRHQRLHPDLEPVRLLLHEHRLVLVVAQAGKIAVVGPIEERPPRVLGLRVGEGGALVEAVDVDAEGRVAGGVALEQAFLDVRNPGGGDQRRQPVLGGDDAVELAARRHLAGPADQRRDAVAALPVGVLLAAEGGGAAVGPGEGLRAVVGGVDDDGVLGDAQRVELVEQLAHLTVVLDHAVGVDAEAGHALRRGLQPGPDVHAAGVEPGEERLVRFVRPVDEVEGGAEELLVDRLHARDVERAGVLAVLLAPRAEAGILAGRDLGGRCAAHHPARPEGLAELGVLGIVGCSGSSSALRW